MALEAAQALPAMDLSKSTLDAATSALPRLAYKDVEVGAMYGASRSWVQERIKDGTFKTVKIAGRRFLLADSVHAVLNQRDDVITEATRIVEASQLAGVLPQ